MDQLMAERDNPKPWTGEKFPQEIRGIYPGSLAVYLTDNSKNLCAGNGAFDLSLCIADNVISLGMDPANAVHDELAIVTLIKYHVSPSERLFRCPEADTVTLMDKKRRHATPGDLHADLLTGLDKLTQGRNIFLCIDNFHMCPPID